MDKIGFRIKQKRERTQIKLTELAERVGVSVSCLSQIENGKAFPSIITLKKIADSLDSTVGELIGENENLINNPVMKIEERKIVDATPTGANIFLLSHHDDSKKMETYSILLPAGASTDNYMVKHSGQEFIYVVKGTVTFTLEQNSYILRQGDSAYFNSNTDHKLQNSSDDESEIIWVITPPNI